jgi:hypothetical protein
MRDVIRKCRGASVDCCRSKPSNASFKLYDHYNACSLMQTMVAGTTSGVTRYCVHREDGLVAVVILSPEEAQIAVSGALPEPSFRPFPGSLRFWELEPELERESEERATLDERKNSDAPPTDADVSVYPADQRLPRIAAAERWKRSAHEVALLVARRSDRLQIIALGTVEGSSRTHIRGARIRGARNIELRVRYVLRYGIPLEEITGALDARQRALLDGMFTGELRPLSPNLGESLVAALTERQPDLASAFRSIQDQVTAEIRARIQARRPELAVPVTEAASVLTRVSL